MVQSESFSAKFQRRKTGTNKQYNTSPGLYNEFLGAGLSKWSHARTKSF
jgi:hypothetical protein